MGNVRMRAEQINYGATNVKVALDDLDPAALIALNNRMDKIDAWKATVKTEEKTGAEVTFTNALALAAVSLSAEIEASQDLHGYDKPWVGGAGKNRYVGSPSFDGYVNPRNTWVKQTETYNGHEVYKKSGEAWSGIYKRFYLPVGTYTFSVAVKTSGNGDGVALFTVLNTDEERAIGDDLNKNTTATNSWTVISNTFTITTAGYVCPRIEKTVDTGDIYISEYQLEIGSTATSYEPYANICPISGHSSVTITRTDAESQTADFTIQLGQTVYGGSLNLTTGVLTVTHANIASYNGETINEPWISSLDEYTQGGTPTTGAQVVYTLATPTTIQLTPEQLTMLKGYNRLSSDGGGDITVEAYTGAAWGGDES